MISIPIFQIDAFSDKVFSGNPAAVCPLDKWLDKKIMQLIAAENNLSETAFFVQEQDGYGLKWFTPEAEIDLCGHATLAAAFVLYNHLGYQGNQINFYTNSGKLVVSREGAMITLNFPSIPLERLPVPPEIQEALGKIPLEVYGGNKSLMAVYESENDIIHIQPNFELIKKLDCRILYITAPGINVDFVSRVFGPAVGVNEDPVTGSAHCCFTPYWAKRLSKKVLTATQVSKRKGALLCEDLGDRVSMSGKAILFLKGEIMLSI